MARSATVFLWADFLNGGRRAITRAASLAPSGVARTSRALDAGSGSALLSRKPSPDFDSRHTTFSAFAATFGAGFGGAFGGGAPGQPTTSTASASTHHLAACIDSSSPGPDPTTAGSAAD